MCFFILKFILVALISFYTKELAFLFNDFHQKMVKIFETKLRLYQKNVILYLLNEKIYTSKAIINRIALITKSNNFLDALHFSY